MTNLVTIRTRGGVPFTVSSSHASRFEGLLNDLEAAGYPIKGDQSGGYNYRNIAGTNKLSNHAHGSAVDVNWSENARGTAGNIPASVARDLAAKHGMTWGGDWKNPDPMHFEVAGAHGHEAPAQRAAPQTQPQGDGTVIEALLAALMSGGGQAAAGAGATGAAGATAAGAGGQSGIFGSLAKGIGLGPQQPDMSGAADKAKAEMQLAQSAMQQVSQPGQGMGTPMQRPIDLTRLREVVAQRPTYGIGRSIV